MKKPLLALLLGFALMFFTRMAHGELGINYCYMAAVSIFALGSFIFYKFHPLLLLAASFVIQSIFIFLNPNLFPLIIPTEFILQTLGVFIGRTARKKNSKTSISIGFSVLILINTAIYIITPHWLYEHATHRGELGKLPQDFVLIDKDQRRYTYDDLKDKTLFLDFWGTYCGYCILNFPNVQDLHRHYEKDSNILVVFVNTGNGDSYEKNLKFIQKNELGSFLYWYDEGSRLTTGMGIEGVPQSFIVKNGVIYWHHRGINDAELPVFTKKAIAEMERIINY